MQSSLSLTVLATLTLVWSHCRAALRGSCRPGGSFAVQTRLTFLFSWLIWAALQFSSPPTHSSTRPVKVDMILCQAVVLIKVKVRTCVSLPAVCDGAEIAG